MRGHRRIDVLPPPRRSYDPFDDRPSEANIQGQVQAAVDGAIRAAARDGHIVVVNLTVQFAYGGGATCVGGDYHQKEH